jgi:phosphohistidine swiveling domain-containing protein
MNVIATGKVSFTTDERVKGTIQYLASPQDVMELLSSDLDDKIGLVRAASGSFASPLLSNRISGLLTMEGDPQSHLGILSREYDIPAVIGVEMTDRDGISADAGTDTYFEEMGESLDGRRVVLDCRDAIGEVLETDE